jgi:HicB family
MDLAPYLDGLRRDLAATAAPAGPDVAQAADLLVGALDASVRLCLLEALSDAADEITRELTTSTVEVRLRGRRVDFVVTEVEHPDDVSTPAPATPSEPSGDVARITLRLPESLKDSVEQAAAVEGVSVNAWLVRAVQGAVHGHRPGPPPPMPPDPPRRRGPGHRITGYGRA